MVTMAGEKMALSPCIECGHQISADAKTCPNCGAKNRAHKSKTARNIAIVVLIVVVAYIAYGYMTLRKYDENYRDYVTKCDTPFKRKSFAAVIDGSAYAQLNKLRVIDVSKIKTIKSGDAITDLVCEATIDFNSRRNGIYRFTWRESESGKLIIKAQNIK